MATADFLFFSTCMRGFRDFSGPGFCIPRFREDFGRTGSHWNNAQNITSLLQRFDEAASCKT
jgi:hypothetical protein